MRGLRVAVLARAWARGRGSHHLTPDVAAAAAAARACCVTAVSGAMKKLFTISDRYHGSGPVLFAWQPDGNFLATAGTNGTPWA